MKNANEVDIVLTNDNEVGWWFLDVLQCLLRYLMQIVLRKSAGSAFILLFIYMSLCLMLNEPSSSNQLQHAITRICFAPKTTKEEQLVSICTEQWPVKLNFCIIQVENKWFVLGN